jgi:hypothetical protein
MSGQRIRDRNQISPQLLNGRASFSRIHQSRHYRASVSIEVGHPVTGIRGANAFQEGLHIISFNTARMVCDNCTAGMT